MKKQFAALLTALSLLPTLALAQEYYTLPEIREQAIRKGMGMLGVRTICEAE